MLLFLCYVRSFLRVPPGGFLGLPGSISWPQGNNLLTYRIHLSRVLARASFSQMILCIFAHLWLHLSLFCPDMLSCHILFLQAQLEQVCRARRNKLCIKSELLSSSLNQKSPVFVESHVDCFVFLPVIFLDCFRLCFVHETREVIFSQV